ncbi:LuxR family transcriptional regulator [Streptomyces sp. AC512_CC834]|uniref:helix-turn-helix transcriptional regulator n=1 Tax=Streptomyces sp. AC512_CC834 TaxID=2823691 RepID=UPI001C259337|nr:AAA family ATPase [Streptomyces sp. AC512_CC834]
MTGPLRERDEAHALLAAEIERARAGTGRLVLLRGASGTGRTAVLETAARHAADRGLRVLRARCSPEDTGVPFATVLQLLGPVPEFTDTAPGGDDRGSAARLWRLLRSYADEGPLLVAVDDVHLADDSSRRWLVEAARRVDRLPLLLVATERSQYDIDPRPAGLTQALSPSLVRTHTLAPLSDTAAAGLVLAAFPGASARWTAQCVRAGAGSPLLLHALLDDLGGTPHPDGIPPVPETCAALYPGSYPAAVSWWLNSVGPATADVARCLAALEQAWPAAPPPRRGEPRHALPHPRTPQFGIPIPRRQTHETPAARTRRPVNIAPGCRDVWSADTGREAFDPGHEGEFGDGVGERGDGGRDPQAPPPYARMAGFPAYGGGPDFRAESPEYGEHGEHGQYGQYGEYGPYPHPAESLHPAGYPDPAAYPHLAGFADEARYPSYPDPFPYDGPQEPVHGAAAHGRTDPPAHAPDRTTQWRTPSPPSSSPSPPFPPSGATDPVDVLAEAAGADPARVAGWLAAMTRLGLLRTDAGGRPRYAHPLLRDAVLSGWPRSRRDAVHRAAAEAMLRRGDRVEAVARHLLHTPAVRRTWALRVLRDAVTVAVHDARPADAVGYLRRALDEPLPDDLRQRLLTELGSLEYASADTPAAIARLAEAQHLPAEPRNRVRTAVALGTALAGRGEIRTAMEVLRRTEGRLSGHPGLARTVQTATALLSDQDLATRQEVYRWLAETGENSPDMVGTAGQALLVRYAATAALVSAEEAMTRVRKLLAQPTDPLAEPFLLGTAAAVAQWADELDEADRLVERGLAGQHPSLLHPMQHALLNTRADIAAARGDHALLLSPVPGPGTGPSNRDAHALMALVHTGRTDEAQRFADRFDLREVPENWELNRYLYARGVSRAATGDLAGALHDFLECGRRQAAREVVSPVVTPWRTAVAECRLALGGGPEALALATEELRLARVWNTPRTVGRALRVLGTATGGRRGLELAEEAVRTLRDAPADTDMELIPALLAQGRQLLAAGERGRARGRLREAAELAERKGALRWLALAGQALREGGARGSAASRTGAGALTGSERRIAELAADGRTNTEIADLLHLARRTVETHLTSTYRKLRIRRRTELPGALDGGGRRERERDRDQDRPRDRPRDAHPNPQS